jgi:hypothetical protein
MLATASPRVGVSQEPGVAGGVKASGGELSRTVVAAGAAEAPRVKVGHV